MQSYMEVERAGGRDVFILSADRHTVGKAGSNDLAIDDPAVSRLHAILERYGEDWAIRDVGSRNGTFVNGERCINERLLRDRDEIRVGSTVCLFRSTSSAQATVTRAAEPAPDLTRREKEVLVALCRPVLSGSMFTRPASIKEMASELVVTENAIKQHLGRMYDKFAIHTDGERMLELANEAIRRGAVNLGDLKQT